MAEKWHSRDIPKPFPKPIYTPVPWYRHEILIIFVLVVLTVIVSLVLGDNLFQ